MKVILASLTCLATTCASASVDIYSLKKLQNVALGWNADYVFSVDQATIDAAINTYGYYNPQFSGWALPDQFDSDSARFYRHYKGMPQQDHFYTTNLNDHYTVLYSYGYTDEGFEGALLTRSFYGAKPFYRLSYYNANTSDVGHYYTHDDAEKQAFLNAGWGYDGIDAYIWPKPAPNVNLAGSSSVGIRTFRGSSGWLYALAAGASDGVNTTSCGGDFDLYVNDNFSSHYGGNQWTYGLLPNNSYSYGCYMLISTNTGAAKYRMEWSGWVARVQNPYTGNVGIQYWVPYTFEQTIPAW